VGKRNSNHLQGRPQQEICEFIVHDDVKHTYHLLESKWVACTLPARAFVRRLQHAYCLGSLLSTASSALPYRRTPPSWLKTTPEDVVDQIVKLARKGLTPSQIGVTLRDSHGIPQVRFVTGNKILRILKSQGMLLICLLITILIHSYAPLSIIFLHLVSVHAPFVWG